MPDKPCFFNPTKIIFGPQAFQQLKLEAQAVKIPGKTVLITGKNSLRKSGYLNKATRLLGSKDLEIFEGVDSNPEVDFIDMLLKAAKKIKARNIVGMGGGSVLDTAKIIALLTDKGITLARALDSNSKFSKRGLSLIAIPSTSGTGSEVTKTSVVWRKAKAQKLSLMSDCLFPDTAIIDPLLTMSLGRYQTATTGLDAFSHAIESYWSKKATVLTRSFSVNSIKLIFGNLKKAYANGKKLNARCKMSLASVYAGLAISHTGTTAAHSVSYALTAVHKIPHGLACALFLPDLIRFNLKKNRKIIRALAKDAGFKKAQDLITETENLIKELKLHRRLSKYGISEKDLDLIVNTGFKTSNISNSIFNITKNDLKAILNKLL